MRLVKALLAGLLVVAIGAMWTNREWVIDAYRVDEAPEPVRLSGVDLDIARTEIEPSPYRLPAAPDTRAIARDTAVGIRPVAQPAVPPSPTLSGGDARLQGTVVGPDGPVPGVIVRVERHTDNGTATLDVAVGDDGEWALGPVAGGRYRVRAWLPGQLTMGRSEVRFVADDQIADFDFSLWGVDPSPRFELVDAGPLYDGLAGTVAVVLGWRSVDLEGLVVTNPVPGAPVSVTATAQVEVLDPQPLLTDASGVAWVRLRCVPTGAALGPASAGPTGVLGVARTQGDQDPATDPGSTAGPAGTLTATSGSTSATFALPGCVPPPPPPEPDPGDPQTGDGSAPGGETVPGDGPETVDG